MEALLFFTIMLVLVAILLQCAMLWHSMFRMEMRGYHDEAVQAIYQH